MSDENATERSSTAPSAGSPDADAANAIPADLAEWVETLRGRFGLASEDVPTGDILALAADAAHGVTRPAAPVSAFVAGLVAGRTGGDPVAVEQVVAVIRALATDWRPSA